jgi:dihydrofolate reductase
VQRVFTQLSVSLDGYLAGPGDGPGNPLGDGGEQLHEWVVELASWRAGHGMSGGRTGPSDDLVAEWIARAGATVMGRRMFDAGEAPWGEEPPFRHPVFVVTHRARDPLARRGGTTFTFVTEGVERALELARAAAGDRDVAVAGGADVVQQLLAAGLLDELEIALVPVLLGGGVRLLDRPELSGVRLALDRAIDAPGVTHLRYVRRAR